MPLHIVNQIGELHALEAQVAAAQAALTANLGDGKTITFSETASIATLTDPSTTPPTTLVLSYDNCVALNSVLTFEFATEP